MIKWKLIQSVGSSLVVQLLGSYGRFGEAIVTEIVPHAICISLLEAA